MIDTEAVERHWIDWVGVAATSLVLAVLVALGTYGQLQGFVATVAYAQATFWIAGAVGLLGAGCCAYLVLEFGVQLRWRMMLAIFALSFGLSIVAVSKGLPAAYTSVAGQPATVRFTVAGYERKKGCRETLNLASRGYDRFSLCATTLGRHPAEGRTILITGPSSPLGLVQQRVVVE